MMVDVVDSKLDVVGVAQGPVRSDELPAIAVMVGDGAVKDDEALRGGVVLAKLSKVQVGIKRVRLRCGVWRGECQSLLAEATREEMVAEVVVSARVGEGQGPGNH